MANALAASFAIYDVDSGVDPHEIFLAAAALQRQVLEHFSPHWGIFGSVRAVVATSPTPRDTEWVIELRKVPTIEGALGFHDEQPNGTPLLYVFPELCAQDNTSWTSCASHEILEALADPFLRRCTQANTGEIWALEVCDAVEADTYKIDTIEVSNFCLPEWGEPPSNLTGVSFDYLNRCTKPYEIRPGGYGQTYDSAKGGWQQVGQMRSYRKTIHGLGLSRGIRRNS